MFDMQSWTEQILLGMGVNTTLLQNLRSDMSIKALFNWLVYIKQLEKTNVQDVQNLREKQLVVLG